MKVKVQKAFTKSYNAVKKIGLKTSDATRFLKKVFDLIEASVNETYPKLGRIDQMVVAQLMFIPLMENMTATLKTKPDTDLYVVLKGLSKSVKEVDVPDDVEKKTKFFMEFNGMIEEM